MPTDADPAARDRQQLQRELLRRARAGTARRTTAVPDADAPADTTTAGAADADRDGHTPQAGEVPSPEPSAACG